MNSKRNQSKLIVESAVIAALYVVLTAASSALGLASGVIQVRFSEALTVLPFFTAAAVPGLAVGCLISNLLTGGAVWDIIFGSVATLVGAAGTYLIGKTGKKTAKWLAPVPPIAANTIIVPLVLAFAYGAEEGIPFLMLTVGIGEVVSCGVLGLSLFHALEKHQREIFGEKTSKTREKM